MSFPMASLGEVVLPVERAEVPAAGTIYRQVGVRLWGVGAYERESIEGSQTKYKTLSRVEADDIIVNKIWARNGSVAIVPKNLAGCHVSSEFPTFVPVQDKLDPRWFHWLTKTKFFWEKCDEKSQGTSGKNRIRPERFLEIEIPLPPLAEQRRIVVHIEELAAKIEEARGLRRRAEVEVVAILPSALDSIYERNGAEKWPRKKLIDEKLAFVIAGQHIMAGEYNSSGDGIPYLTGPADFGPKVPEIRHWTLNPKSTSLPGDILLTVKGAGVGKINLAPDVESAIGRQLMAVRSNPEKLLREFVYYFLNHRFKHFQSIATATTVPGFKKNDVEELVVPVPPLPEQHRMVTYLDNLQAKVDTLRRLQAETSAELNALLPAVLDKAFKGEM